MDQHLVYRVQTRGQSKLMKLKGQAKEKITKFRNFTEVHNDTWGFVTSQGSIGTCSGLGSFEAILIDLERLDLGVQGSAGHSEFDRSS